MHFGMCFTDDFDFTSQHIPLSYHLIESTDTRRLDNPTITQSVVDVNEIAGELRIADAGLHLMTITFRIGHNAIHIITIDLVLAIIADIYLPAGLINGHIPHIGQFIRSWPLGTRTGQITEILLVEQMDSPVPCLIIHHDEIVLRVTSPRPTSNQHVLTRIDFHYLVLHQKYFTPASLMFLPFILWRAGTKQCQSPSINNPFHLDKY